MKKLLKWVAISIGGLFALLIVIAVIAGDPEDAEAPPAGGPKEASAQYQYTQSVQPILQSVGTAASKIVTLTGSPAYSNPQWRDRLFSQAQALISAELELRELEPPDGWQDVHEALLMGLDLQSQAARLIQLSLDAFGRGNELEGARLLAKAIPLVREAGAHIGFATILIEEGTDSASADTLNPRPEPTPTPNPAVGFYEERGLPPPDSPGLLPPVDVGPSHSRVRYTLIELTERNAGISNVVSVVLRVQSLQEGEGMSGGAPWERFYLQLPGTKDWRFEQFPGSRKIYLTFNRETGNSALTGVGPIFVLWVPDGLEGETMLSEPDKYLMLGRGTEGLLMLRFRVASEIDTNDLILYYMREELFTFRAISVN